MRRAIGRRALCKKRKGQGMGNLPEQFEKRMERMLDREFPDFLSSFSVKARSGLRVNTLKASAEEFAELADWELRPIPWIANGFFYPETAAPSKHPWYYAGLYYLQEPSAMTPANLLPVEPGMKVLDLCAAPGGKSTELAAKLKGEGVLVANDISNSRAKALLKNLELFGVRNALVTSETPAALAARFPGYFDRILVDAPCSGEGMFRKQPAIMKNWEQYGTGYYAKLQREILPHAVSMLRPGGYLMYSTCTFSPEEDEETVDWLLRSFPEMRLADAVPAGREAAYREMGFVGGRPDWMRSPREEITKTVRLFPHKLEGEGHFLALLQKREDAGDGAGFVPETGFAAEKKLPSELRDFFEGCTLPVDFSRIICKEEKYYWLPEGIPSLRGLRLLRSGLLLGEQRKGRFEPSQALACALRKQEYCNSYSLPVDDERVIRYLKCETIELPETVPDGYVLLCADAYPLGFVKKKGSHVKNRYLPGWRLL